MFEHGADTASVRNILGHASVQTAERHMLNKRKYGDHAALKNLKEYYRVEWMYHSNAI
ncbi:hypothetical protein [Bacillus piscicola]|uniref:hypothetical protein n=1 Tax=Bacillus piscicola TaxID=1632684 RepID=UPI001F0914D5|nr:hypothetical protein [Bacillus piscicola]